MNARRLWIVIGLLLVLSGATAYVGFNRHKRAKLDAALESSQSLPPSHLNHASSSTAPPAVRSQDALPTSTTTHGAISKTSATLSQDGALSGSLAACPAIAVALSSKSTTTSLAKKEEDRASETNPLIVQVYWNDNGAPAAGTTVGWGPTGQDKATTRTQRQETTNAAGRAVLKVDKSIASIWLSIKHPESVRLPYSPVVLPVAKPVVLRLDRGYSVFGTVYKTVGGKEQPVPGAFVKVNVNKGPSIKSGPDGKYVIGGVKLGDIELKASFGNQITPSSQNERNIAHVDRQALNGPYDLHLKGGVNLTGAVIDKQTGKPIAGAQVTAFANLVRQSYNEFDKSSMDKEFVTAADGVFVFKNNPEGPLKIRALADGYGEVFKQVPLVRGKENTVVLEIGAGGKITAIALDKDDKPVPAAVLNVRREGGHYWAGTSGKDGRAILDNVKIGVPYTVFFWKYSSFGTEETPVTLTPDKPTAEIILHFKFRNSEIEGSGVIAGTVRDEKGQPVGGATVYCQQAWAVGSNRNWYTGLTNVGGQYQIEAQAPDGNDYFMAVQCPGFSPGWREQVGFGTADKPARQDFKLLKAHWLSGIVVDESGKPLAGVVLRALPVDANIFSSTGHPGMGEQTTAADGKFLLKDLSGPTVTITARKAGWQFPPGRTVDVDREMKLVLKAAGEIAGRVVDATTLQPITDFSVRIAGMERWGTEQQITNQGGVFRVRDLIQGQSYEIQLEAPGHQPMKIALPALAPGSAPGTFALK